MNCEFYYVNGVKGACIICGAASEEFSIFCIQLCLAASVYNVFIVIATNPMPQMQI